ncbi:MAG: AraC family transcriptional regulator [Verrucomicrobiaceae bacterium]|nr:AraC family transcriptional regulator [Verrucomicrobiaceae bacterium]
MVCSRILRGRNRLGLVCSTILLTVAAFAQTTFAQTNSAPSANAPTAPQRALNEQTQDIKKQALELNRDLFNLEEELLFPANTQVAVFVSLDTGEFFQLDAVQIKLDDKIVANYLYTEKQVDALHRGGVQRLYVGNVKGGKHEIVAVLTGRGPHNRDYRRGTTFTFDKADQPKYVELKIVDSTANFEPDFQIKEWQ